MTQVRTSLETLIASEAAKKEYRDSYNQRPEVKDRRKLYNALRLEEAKVARKVIKGDMTPEAGNKKLESLRKAYDIQLAKLNGQPEASRAQTSTNNGS